MRMFKYIMVKVYALTVYALPGELLELFLFFIYLCFTPCNLLYSANFRHSWCRVWDTMTWVLFFLAMFNLFVNVYGDLTAKDVQFYNLLQIFQLLW